MPFCGPRGADRADDRPGAADPGRGEDPLVILRERYARGEIDHAEFETALDGLLRTERPLRAGRQ